MPNHCKKKEFPVPKIIISLGMQILSKRNINTFDNFDLKYYTKFHNNLWNIVEKKLGQ